MVLDYHERKPVSKNRPRKHPVGIFTFVLIGAVAISFALGLLSGWFMFKPSRKTAQGQASLAPNGTKNVPVLSSPSAQLQNPEASGAKVAEPPLTFYETLPKGGKAVIGSGLNPKKNEALAAPKPAAITPLPAQQTAAPLPAALPAEVNQTERKVQVPAPVEQASKTAAANSGPSAHQATEAAKFCVQVASYQVRKDADAIKSKMTAKGLPVYVVESKVKDKGTWYRVRIGKHLTQQEAGELAVKTGKGALVIPE